MTDLVERARLQAYGEPGSMGVVRDTHYRNCYWPKLDQPTAIFADGSSGLIVEGPPTPRNVLFPPDTQFVNGTRGDCFFLRHTEAVPMPNGKNRYDDYVSELTVKEVEELAAKKASVADLIAVKEFVAISDSPMDAAAKKYTVSKVGRGTVLSEKADVADVEVSK